jgi:hypothetical protein
MAIWVLSGVIHGIGSISSSTPFGGDKTVSVVTELPGKCSSIIVFMDSSGEMLNEPSCFLTRPNLFVALSLSIFDGFAMSGRVSTSLTNS